MNQLEICDFLLSYRRYRRACQHYPDNDWSDDIFNQWKADSDFRQEVYEIQRRSGFRYAATYAQEQLFLRCFNII